MTDFAQGVRRKCGVPDLTGPAGNKIVIMGDAA